MTTSVQAQSSNRAKSSNISSGAKRVGQLLINGLLILISLLAGLPVLIMLLGTGVPLPVSIGLVLVDIGLVVAAFRFLNGTVSYLAAALAVITVAAAAVWLSQVYAMTPPITNEAGEPLAGSIASLEKVELNGSQQWISIRGQDRDNPILLFLAGGPGGSQMTTARHALAELEEDFVVVQWDQPGAGKSFYALPQSELNPERYVLDGLALTDMLRNRFERDKIYLLGESWGSVLGIWMAQRSPDKYHAFIGTGQMVAFEETDLVCYEFALELARERGDQGKVDQLRQQGPPPYYGDGVAMKQINYLKDTYAYMNNDPNIRTNFNTIGDIMSPEYGLIDKVNWVRGPLVTLGTVYQDLWEVDLRQSADALEVPVYVLIGRHDVNAPVDLAEDYVQQLEAPIKEIVWFEHSGHSPWTSETDRFVEVIVDEILPETLALQ